MPKIIPDFLYDAHVHLAERALSNEMPQILSAYDQIGLGNAVVVGTSPEDWADVIALAEKDRRFIPAIGLHPWRVNDAPEDWQDQMLHDLDQGVGIIGEIGLDQWVEDHDIEQQRIAFQWQLSLATERNLPTSIHCLKAHEPLLEILKATQLPARGFKLHAYNGPVDTIRPLLDLGAHFSFNGGQLKNNAKNVQELIQLVPDDRLLIETDAPDFLPPKELRDFKLSDPGLCHPANISASYRAIAELRGNSYEDLAEKVALNFQCYFVARDQEVDE